MPEGIIEALKPYLHTPARESANIEILEDEVIIAGRSYIPKPEAIGHFDILRSANKERQKEWDKGGNMTLSYMGNELAGETGELCNVVKKLEREVFGMAGSRATIGMAQQEAADVVICIDLLAARLGFDLWGAVVAKFNYTSEKNGFITKIEGQTP